MGDYDDGDWVQTATENFGRWWSSYLRKAEDKTDLARSIALDSWLACRYHTEEEWSDPPL